MMPIYSGTTADIVFEGHDPNSQLHTMIYDVVDRRVIISQTIPPVDNDQIGKRLLVTFLEKNEVGNARYGFWAKLMGLLTDYELTTSQRLPALILEMQTDPKNYNFRMSYRIKPLPNKGLAVFLQGEAVTILDISVGGIRISTGTDRSFNPHDMLTLTLNVDDKKFDVEGSVIKVAPSLTYGIESGHQQVAIAFMSRQTEREMLLGEKIFRLDRERLAQVKR